MKKIVLLLLLVTIINAQEDTLKNYSLGEVVVTSSHNNLVKSSSVIDVKLNEIKKTDGYNVTDPLKFLTGLYITTIINAELSPIKSVRLSSWLYNK